MELFPILINFAKDKQVLPKRVGSHLDIHTRHLSFGLQPSSHYYIMPLVLYEKYFHHF